MTTNSNLKKLVRARMKQTGERYTTALAAIQAIKPAPKPPSAAPASSEKAKE